MVEDGVFPLADVDDLLSGLRARRVPAARGRPFVPYLSVLDLLLQVGPERALERDPCRQPALQSLGSISQMPAGSLQIAGRTIGPGHPVWVVAELSGNHGGRARAGRAARARGGSGRRRRGQDPDLQGRLAHDRLRRSAVPRCRMAGAWDGTAPLRPLPRGVRRRGSGRSRSRRVADELGIAFFSSPFDATAVDFLEALGVPAYKIASFELVDTAADRAGGRDRQAGDHVDGHGDPRGDRRGRRRRSRASRRARARAAQVHERLPGAARAAPPAHDRATWPREFGVPIGLSDHTVGARRAGGRGGARRVHRREAPHALNRARRRARRPLLARAARVRGDGPQHPRGRGLAGRACSTAAEGEDESRAYRRSLFVVDDVPEGALFTEANVRSIRPADGLAPKELRRVLGRRAARDIPRGTPLSWELIERDLAGCWSAATAPARRVSGTSAAAWR